MAQKLSPAQGAQAAQGTAQPAQAAQGTAQGAQAAQGGQPAQAAQAAQAAQGGQPAQAAQGAQPAQENSKKGSTTNNKKNKLVKLLFGKIVTGKMPSLLTAYFEDNVADQATFTELVNFFKTSILDVKLRLNAKPPRQKNANWEFTEKIQKIYAGQANNVPVIDEQLFQVSVYRDGLAEVLDSYDETDLKLLKQIIEGIETDPSVKQTLRTIYKHINTKKFRNLKFQTSISNSELAQMLKKLPEPGKFLTGLNYNGKNSYLKSKEEVIKQFVENNPSLPQESLEALLSKLQKQEKQRLRVRITNAAGADNRLKQLESALNAVEKEIGNTKKK